MSNGFLGGSPLQEVLSRLECVRPAGEGKHQARCPAHDDSSPSLSIGVGDDGRVLLNCFAGCEFDDIVKALGLSKADLFPPKGPPPKPKAKAKAKANPKPPGEPWLVQVERLSHNLTPALAEELAGVLGLPVAVLEQLELLGYDPKDHHGPCWTFPERDGRGVVIGYTRRYRNGDKKAANGGSRGLTILAGWRDRGGPLLLPEGNSNPLALAAAGLSCVGRPNNHYGDHLLADLLQDAPPGRNPIVVGDNDEPGRKGAESVAGKLTARLGRPIGWALPPDGFKDVRAWLTARAPDPTDADAWSAAGERLLDSLVAITEPEEATPETPAPAAPETGGLHTTCLATLKPQPIHWLVPGYFPLGKLVMLAGDGGHGKTSLTLHMIASTSRARPCFGLAYDAPTPSESLLISCEDDYEDTIVPRLLSAAADMTRVHRVDGVRTDDGKLAPFSMAHYEALKVELERRPAIRLVVIDPAGAYIGKAGVDDHKDSELRAVLGPMAELAAARRVTILLVKHLNKGVGAKAIHKVGGSTGYVNAVRAAFVVAPDPDEPAKKLLLPLKFNLGPKPRGLSYRLRALDPEDQEYILRPFDHLGDEDRALLATQLFGITWDGEVDIDADTALADASKREGSGSTVKEAAEWLAEFLAEFAYPSEEIFEAGKEKGFSQNTLYKAKDELGIKPSNKGYQGRWHWGIGDAHRWRLRPSVSGTSGPTKYGKYGKYEKYERNGREDSNDND